MNKNVGLIRIIIVVLAVGLIGILILFVLKRNNTSSNTSDPQTVNISEWREVIFNSWQFKIPPSWHYFSCNENSVVAGVDVIKDQVSTSTYDCPQSTVPGVVTITKSPINSIYEGKNKKEILVGKEKAIWQQEKVAGKNDEQITVYVISRNTTFHWKDLVNTHVFEALLSNFSWIDANALVKDWCEKEGGKYLPTYSECEGITSASCEAKNGSFNDCVSACRHQPPTQVCIELCVPVCKL